MPTVVSGLIAADVEGRSDQGGQAGAGSSISSKGREPAGKDAGAEAESEGAGTTAGAGSVTWLDTVIPLHVGADDGPAEFVEAKESTNVHLTY